MAIPKRCENAVKNYEKGVYKFSNLKKVLMANGVDEKEIKKIFGENPPELMPKPNTLLSNSKSNLPNEPKTNDSQSLGNSDKKNFTNSNKGSTLGNFFYDILRKNDNFKIVIYPTDGGDSIIEGYMSETLNFGISANYSNAYSNNGLLSNIASGIEGINKLYDGTNIGINHSISGLLFWDSSSFQDMSFSFEILATNKNDNIILNTVKKLSKYVLPTQGSGKGGLIWDAPGGYSLGGGVLEQLKNSSNIEATSFIKGKTSSITPKGTLSVKIGKYFDIRGGVITNFTYNIDKEVMRDTGYPLKARISITLKLIFPISQQRFESWFIS